MGFIDIDDLADMTPSQRLDALAKMRAQPRTTLEQLERAEAAAGAVMYSTPDLDAGGDPSLRRDFYFGTDIPFDEAAIERARLRDEAQYEAERGEFPFGIWFVAFIIALATAGVLSVALWL